MRRTDEGTAMGLQATAVGLGIGAMIWAGHTHAMEKMRADRAAREQAAYDAAVAGNIARLAGIARTALRDLGRAHAEIDRLKRALALRQSYIDRQRAAA